VGGRARSRRARGLTIGTARGKSASGRENRSVWPGEAVLRRRGGGGCGGVPKDDLPVTGRGGEG